MSLFTDLYYAAVNGDAQLADPGDGNSIVVDRLPAVLTLQSAGPNETRILDAPPSAGLLLAIMSRGTDDIAVSVASGSGNFSGYTYYSHDQLLFQYGSFAVLHSFDAGDGFVWRSMGVMKSTGFATRDDTETLSGKTLLDSVLAGGVATKRLKLDTVTVAAAGTTQGTAALIPDAEGVTVRVIDASGVSGVRLPSVSNGGLMLLFNDSANSLVVYPSASQKINGDTPNSPITVAPKETKSFAPFSSALNWGAK